MNESEHNEINESVDKMSHSDVPRGHKEKGEEGEGYFIKVMEVNIKLRYNKVI